MIQRKQTLFLLFSLIIMIGYIFAPLVKILGVGQSFYTYSYSFPFSVNVKFPIIGHYFVFPCLVAACVAIGIHLLTIFLFMFRRVQIFFCWLSILPLLYAFCYAYYKWSVADTTLDQYFYFGNISPLVAVVLVFVAMFYIRKDEELVKSVDRLR